MDNAKLNFAPPSENTFWYKLDSVLLRNGEHVQVARKYDIRSEGALVSDETLALLREAVLDHQSDLRDDERAADWIGVVVANTLGKDIGIGTKSAKERSDDQIKARSFVKLCILHMMALGWLRTVERKDGRNGRMVKFVEAVR